jgi:UDP-N-acetylmuramate-alanine ligase
MGAAPNPFADPRGPRPRAQVLRDLAHHPAEVTADLDRIRRQTGEQLGLW